MDALIRKPIPASDKELVECFESLGDNCEFGFLQRYAGAEPLSLFRFNFTLLERLIHGLSTRFGDLARSGNVEVKWTNEWMITESNYKLYYHSGNDAPDYSLDRLINEQTRWLNYMSKKFIEELETGDRIYVRKGENADQEASIRALSSALRQFGSVTLLWVTVEDELHPSGSVEWIGDGLIRGWIEKFSPYERTPDVHTVSWIDLLRRVWALRYLGDENSFPSAARENFLSPSFGGWHGSSAAISEFAWEIPRSPRGGQVMKHVLCRDTYNSDSGVFSCLLTSGLVGGALLVASAFIWLPPGFEGQVGIGFHGRATISSKAADLSITSKWQKIWASAHVAEIDPVAYVRVYVTSGVGATCYSSDWRLELGGIPTIDYREKVVS